MPNQGRRFRKRLYIPLPDNEGRLGIIKNLLKNQRNSLSAEDLNEICRKTDG